MLLSPTTDLKEITIEGVSPSDPIVEGEEIIDVGEYYGSEQVENASLVRYIQVKHSTVRTEVHWLPSELESTLNKFSTLYKSIQEERSEASLENKVEFWFVSNRPIAVDFLKAISDVAQGLTLSDTVNLTKLERFTGLNNEALRNFCGLLRLEGNHPCLWDQRNTLTQEICTYLAGSDEDAPIRLKELVTRKALSESKSNPQITRYDVLRALHTDEDKLFPAKYLINPPENTIERAQEAAIHQRIVETNGSPIIIHADGGVGKSIFATRIRLGLPPDSACIVYDCFGNGSYRSASTYRHRHKDALVQIANELASQGLCYPLIPTPHTDSSDYVRAFFSRLRQSIEVIRSKNADGLLCIVVDAADNAQMAAEEIQEPRSFVRDLIRENLPEGLRLVFLCRTHRQEFLAPPSTALRIELDPFSLSETEVHLRQKFENATPLDINEFHRLSSQNPRVQAIALLQANASRLSDILAALGPNPTTVECTINNLLQSALDELRDRASNLEQHQINQICVGLATLRPLIPLSVLSAMSNIDESAIRSFTFDLGTPLLVLDNTIQFRDEPSETWFREQFKPTNEDLLEFIRKLRPLAANSGYVASILPQLMLEAGLFDELVEMALNSNELPTNSPIEKRDIELQRLHFALKASLRSKRYIEAAKLALKAGGESAGNKRQNTLLQENTDLAAIFMEPNSIQNLVSRRTFGTAWRGSHNAYEASLMSGCTDLLSDACSRFRMAREWLQNWSQLPDDTRGNEEISDLDLLEMATAVFNIFGAVHCANYLRQWTPREISFRVGKMLASRFVDHGRYQDLENLSIAAGNDLYLILAITLELQVVHRCPPQKSLKRALRLTSKVRINLNDKGYGTDDLAIQAVVALVQAGYKQSVWSSDKLAKLLRQYLPESPPRELASDYNRSARFLFLRAYSLFAILTDQPLQVMDLADSGLRQEIEKADRNLESSDMRRFKEQIGDLLPWHLLWAKAFICQLSSTDIANAINDRIVAAQDAERHRYQESNVSNDIAKVWFDILIAASNTATEFIAPFQKWITDLNRPLFTQTLIHLTRISARIPGFESFSLDYASNAFDIVKGVRENVGSTAHSYIQLSRAVLTISKEEASAYFDEAVKVVSEIGDESMARWEALLSLSDQAATKETPNAMLAYRFARCAEVTYGYAHDKHFPREATVKAITGISGSSAFAILSRWRDRGFGSSWPTLPIAVEFLVARGDIKPQLALTLLGFQSTWNEPFLLERVLESTQFRKDQSAAVDFTYRYMVLEEHRSSKWHELKRVLTKYALLPADLDERISLREREEKEIQSGYSTMHETERAPNWDAVFDGIDLSRPEDISVLYQRCQASISSYDKTFIMFEAACLRVTPGQESLFISALAQMSQFDQYDLNNFMKAIPDNWRNRISVNPALTSLVKEVCRRFCLEITNFRYDSVPIRKICDATQIPMTEVIDIILDAIGKTSETLSAERLFFLVGILAPQLTTTEAQDALSFGLDLLNPVLKETDGDGPWTDELMPPTDTEESIAGYIWSCLASPYANVRWEAAHVVRALCTFGQQKTLNYLILFADGKACQSFQDKRFFFYELHGRQWLLLGLARAVKDHPAYVSVYSGFFKKLAFQSPPHILIQKLAKTILLSLIDSGFLTSDDDFISKLSKVNTSPFPTTEQTYYQRANTIEADKGIANDAQYELAEFSFGLDFGSYWLAPLGRCFSKNQKNIEHEVVSVIRNTWQITTGNRWDDDARHKAGIFERNETYHTHGSYPSVDNMRFYLSYHAMMVVAGKLLMTTPSYKDPNSYGDDFQSWLTKHSLSRKDGNWLADRRDPIPLERPEWKDTSEKKDWSVSVKHDDFDNILIDPMTKKLNLWGNWAWVSQYREESIQVYSALVSPDRSVSLLSALQTVENHHDYRIPAADDADDLQINFEKFQLKGWIVDSGTDNKLDEYDPWAGKIRYTAPVLSPEIIKIMQLHSDSENRTWSTPDDVQVAWSQVWRNCSERNTEAEEKGHRFQVSFSFVIRLLNQLKMDLIVEVGIERRLCYPNNRGAHDDDTRSVPPKLFLIRANGEICTV